MEQINFHKYCSSPSIDLEKINSFLSNKNVNELDEFELTPLFHIFENNSPNFHNKMQVIEILLEKKASPNICNEYENTILHIISRNLHQSIFPQQQEKKEDTKRQDDSNFLLFDLLDQIDHSEKIEEEKKVEENQNVKKNLELIELLLKYNANPNLENNSSCKKS